MFKKLTFFLAVILISANMLTACKPNANSSNVSPTDLIALLNKKSTAITIKPGWLHVTEMITYDVDKENLGILSNNTVIPLQYNTDTWYHVNQQGRVYEYVQIQSSMKGDVLQVNVFMNQVIVNLMTNYVVAMTPYNLGAMDYRFSNEMADYTSRTGQAPKLKLSTVDGRQAAIFTIAETFSEPATTENFNEPVYSIRTLAYYDTTSGLLFRLERIRIFKDNSERTFYRTDIAVEQNATPSQEILDYLKGIN